MFYIYVKIKIYIQKGRVMKRLHLIDKKDYDTLTHVYERQAVRAVILKKDKLVMIQSQTFGEYKFPGGGLESEESLIETLMRETKEETGLTVIASSVSPIGYIEEKRKSSYEEHTIFQMKSYYFLCDTLKAQHETNLDDYEKAYGYQLTYVTLDEAIKQNEHALETYGSQAYWIERELWMLKFLKKHEKTRCTHETL